MTPLGVDVGGHCLRVSVSVHDLPLSHPRSRNCRVKLVSVLPQCNATKNSSKTRFQIYMQLVYATADIFEVFSIKKSQRQINASSSSFGVYRLFKDHFGPLMPKFVQALFVIIL